MCPIDALHLRGPMKRGSCQAPGLVALYQSAWIGWLILGCVAASAKQSSSLSGKLENSVNRPPVETASYAYPEQQHLHVTRHRSSPPVSIYRSPASLKGGHGELQKLQDAQMKCCVEYFVNLSHQKTRKKDRKVI